MRRGAGTQTQVPWNRMQESQEVANITIIPLLLTKLTVILLNSLHFFQHHTTWLSCSNSDPNQMHVTVYHSKIFPDLYQTSSLNPNIITFLPKMFIKQIIFRISHVWDLSKIFLMWSFGIYVLYWLPPEVSVQTGAFQVDIFL